MKQILLLSFALCLLIGFSSCEKDGDFEIKKSNNITYGKDNYDLKDAGFIDYKNLAVFGSIPTHHNVDFFTIDGSFKLKRSGEFEDIKGKFALKLSLNSPNLTTFEEGVYTFLDDSKDNLISNEEIKNKYAGKRFFSEGYVINGSESTSLLTFNSPVDIISGTVTLKGIAPNFIMAFDLMLENGKSLKGSYNGNFKNL